MKRVILVIIGGAFIVGCAANSQSNLLPMYGLIPKSNNELEADNKFLKTVDAEGRTRDSSSKYFSSLGWKFYYQGNDVLAMKRFNQAWLLDSTNASAYFGFGSILGRRRSPIDSVIMLMKLAHNYDTRDLPIAVSLAYSYSTKAYQQKLNNDSKWNQSMDSSLNIYQVLMPNLKFETSYGIQYLESLVMLGIKEKSLATIALIDSTKLDLRQKSRFSFLVSEAAKLK